VREREIERWRENVSAWCNGERVSGCVREVNFRKERGFVKTREIERLRGRGRERKRERETWIDKDLG